MLFGSVSDCSFMTGCAAVGSLYSSDDDDGDFYSATLALRQTTGNKADGGQ
jgi:hypothetical protein